MILVFVLFLASTFLAYTAGDARTKAQGEAAAAVTAKEEADAARMTELARSRNITEVLGYYNREDMQARSDVEQAKQGLSEFKSSFPGMTDAEGTWEEAWPKASAAYRDSLGKVKTLAATSLLSPLALTRLYTLYRAPSYKAAAAPTTGARKFYLHTIVSVQSLKQLGKAHGLGSLSSTLTSAITAAYFTALPHVTSATVANNVLFDADRPDGNHVCLKVATVGAPPAVDDARAESWIKAGLPWPAGGPWVTVPGTS